MKRRYNSDWLFAAFLVTPILTIFLITGSLHGDCKCDDGGQHVHVDNPQGIYKPVFIPGIIMIGLFAGFCITKSIKS